MKISALIFATASLVKDAKSFTASDIKLSSRPCEGCTTSELQRNRSKVFVRASGDNEVGENSRRALFQSMTGIAFSMLVHPTTRPQPAWAGSLLDDFGTDPQKIQQKTAPPEVIEKKVSKDGNTYEPNLRSNYYYPTNKKRYLPRIKKCNDAIPLVANSIGIEDWDAVSDFALKVADDTILPMKLYTSSLTGGGTNVKLSFTKDMMNSANKFETGQKQLVKALNKKDRTSASTALEEMATALLTYRTVGKLLGPDGGGDIPSVDEIRRSACRVQGRTFEKKVMERDARLREAASGA